MALLCLICGSETWTLSRGDERQLEAAEARFLRNVAGQGMRKLDKQINTRKEDNLAGASTEDAIRKSSQATVIP